MSRGAQGPRSMGASGGQRQPRDRALRGLLGACMSHWRGLDLEDRRRAGLDTQAGKGFTLRPAGSFHQTRQEGNSHPAVELAIGPA